MAKITGVAITTFSIDDATGTPVDCRSDISDFDFDTPRAVQDVTGLDKSAIERLLLLADGQVNISGVVNPTGAHLVLRTASSTSVKRTVTIGFGGVSLAMEMWITSYAVARSASGELTYKSSLVLADGAVPTWA